MNMKMRRNGIPLRAHTKQERDLPRAKHLAAGCQLPKRRGIPEFLIKKERQNKGK